jgi:mono/diheme cytochrome c family protein
VSANARFARRGGMVIFAAALTGCSWFTDFRQQPKIDPWESSNDSIPPRGSPQYSVSIYGSSAPGFEYAREPLPANITAMASILNPTRPDSASVNRGRVQFQINCEPCHGPLGMGNGPVTKYGMPPIPIGAGTAAADKYTDGYIFGMIRNGRGMMPTYNRIEEMDRWDIVNYLRSIQGKLPGFPPDTAHGRPGETGSLVPGASRMGPTRPVPFWRPTNAPRAGTDTARAAAPADSTKKPEGQR